jgi:ribosomal protein L11 methyltransferase
MDLAPVLTGCLAPGGRLVLSGLLAEQAEEVAAAYRSTCGVTGSAEREGWSRLDLNRM